MNLNDIDYNAVIKSARLSGEDFVDIFIESKISTLLSNEGKRLEKAINGMIQGAGLRLISNKKTYYAYTNNLEENNLMNIAKELKVAAAGDINKKDKNAAGFKSLNSKEKTAENRF